MTKKSFDKLKYHGSNEVVKCLLGSEKYSKSLKWYLKFSFEFTQMWWATLSRRKKQGLIEQRKRTDRRNYRTQHISNPTISVFLTLSPSRSWKLSLSIFLEAIGWKSTKKTN